MIKRLFAKLGYVPVDEVNLAYDDGRIDGRHDVQEQFNRHAESLKAQYAGIERHRDALLQVLSRHASLQSPQAIIIREEHDG